MALKPCKECGQQVSTKADKCPHCGTGNPTGKMLDTSLSGNLKSCGCLIVLAILLMLFIAL